jgi:hypothetical protein
VTVIVFAIFPTLVTTPVLISGIVSVPVFVVDIKCSSTTVDPTFTD